MIKFNKVDILFAIMVIWTFVTAIANHDFSFFSAMITSILFYLIIKLYYNNTIIKSEDMIKYLVVGISTGIIFSLFIKLELLNFKSYHISRYAIGERADPNSTGFLFAIISMYFFLNFINNLDKDVRTIFINAILVIISLSCLFLTQSRGSVLCLLISIFTYIIFSLFKVKKFNIKVIFKVLLFFIIAIMFLTFLKPITILITNSWEAFENRLLNAESSDGERGYLIKESFNSFFENPITGTNLEMFKNEVGHIPHNTFCDYMVTNGFFGMIFYIIFFVFPILQAIKSKIMYIKTKAFYIYLVAFLNILLYSASNEKIIFLLLLILIISKDEIRREKEDV